MLVVGLFFGCTATRPAGGPKPVEPTLVTTGETTETGSGAGTLGDFPAPFAADYLWATLTFDDATDFGFVPSEIPLAETVEPGPVVLVEHASEAGLGASVVGGDTHGVGVGAFDVDGDGWDDIFVASGVGAVSYSSAVWHNNGDGTFSDGSEVSGVLAALAGVDAYSVAAADYDADGDFDVYVGAIPYGILLRNDGGVLSDVTGAANAAGPESVTPGGVSKIAAWGDYDNDGWLDLVAASSTFTTAPENGYLLRNQGDGTFADVSTATALQFSGEGNPCAVLWTDYDNDGDLDLNVWNDRGGAFTNRSLLRNDGGVWTDVTVAAHLTNDVGNPMGIDGADVDRNGFSDYYLGNIGGNPLFLGQADGTFVDNAAAAGVLGSFGWGLAFEDLDADTWWDIFVAEEDARPYLTFTHNRDTPPTFTQQEWQHVGVDKGHNIPVAFADFDHDFDVDMVSGNTAGQPLALFRNDTNRGTNRFLEVEIADSPGFGDRGGITARVVVKMGPTVLWRDITGGSSRASQNAVSARFGLGQWTGAEWVAVLWPDGRQVSAVNVPGNSRVYLSGPAR